MDRLGETPLPATVVGKHPIGFKDVLVLAFARQIAMADHFVNDSLELDHGRIEPHRFGDRIVGGELGDDDARLVQHRMAERDAFRDGLALDDVSNPAAELQRHVGARNARRDELLGEHHRRRVQDLDVLVGVFARRLVLDRQDAKHVAAAQDRNGEERVIDLLARFRTVRKRGMALRVGFVDRDRHLGTAPDEALAAVHECAVDRRWIESFGREEL